jgi:hypothetical protein
MSVRIIQVRPSCNPRWQKKGGWEVFEAEGVQPVYCGENGRQNALDYAQQPAHSFARTNLRARLRRFGNELANSFPVGQKRFGGLQFQITEMQEIGVELPSEKYAIIGFAHTVLSEQINMTVRAHRIAQTQVIGNHR